MHRRQNLTCFTDACCHCVERTTCFNVKMGDRISIVQMHLRANLLSLEQRRQKQLLNLMFICKLRHENIRRIHGRNTRAANVYSFTRERYHNDKYKNNLSIKVLCYGTNCQSISGNVIHILSSKKRLNMYIRSMMT